MKPKLKVQRLPAMEKAIAEMKPYTETRGRPRKFADPANLVLKVEKEDRDNWKAAAAQAGTSLNQWVIAQLNKSTKAE